MRSKVKATYDKNKEKLQLEKRRTCDRTDMIHHMISYDGCGVCDVMLCQAADVIPFGKRFLQGHVI